MQDVLRAGLAGLGTVGASVVRLIARHENDLAVRCGRPMRVAAVSARSRDKDRGIDISSMAWFDDPVALATSDDIDVFVELIGGDSGPAEDAVRAALKAGKHVVTANKALLAKHGVELARLAEENGASLNFEAAVAGGIPIVKVMRESLAGNAINRVYGILNGTCNYILTQMEQEQRSFAECLAEAQRLGYAEADPTFDIEGNDTAHKLAILTSLAFGTEIDDGSIYIEGISSITLADIEAADELGYRIKLLGVAQRTETGIEQRVHPTMVPKSSAIARIDGVLNAIAVDADFVGEIVLVGPGAGGEATASSVVGDMADLGRGLSVPVLGRPAGELEPYRRARMRLHEGGYYIRLEVYDRPGAFARIATRMAEKQISLESIVQRRDEAPNGAGKPTPVILITYETTEAAIREAMEQIADENVIAAAPQVIRIEKMV
ncbi:homoserine dehydrogenase [Rhodobium orientis]|uniref:Homoserine dehydrogenase n=1 Tax=Rhodobium orientis TaxID=34017 RepID=A0A327JLY0_9HYPH|nr:homoserine dehydrogenase [Rhodobium orientis]MBB4302397.1 homoserine dehydrogenase [Rhodobium orientis]MBK5949101.1 homoserine dehydrogenase [Rhodobium orientis]RAI26576.1 homoserine dehydrogenase [Rhodobium orientis]